MTKTTKAGQAPAITFRAVPDGNDAVDVFSVNADGVVIEKIATFFVPDADPSNLRLIRNNVGAVMAEAFGAVTGRPAVPTYQTFDRNGRAIRVTVPDSENR